MKTTPNPAGFVNSVKTDVGASGRKRNAGPNLSAKSL
jgi:hypothetical protein